MPVTFDTSKFDLRCKRVQRIVAEVGAKVIKEGAQDIYNETGKKLKGPHYGYHTGPRGGYVPNYPEGGGQKGKVPIPRLTGTLAKSLQMRPLSTLTWAVYADDRMANYAKFIHDGTRHMRPRRFLKDTFTERAPAINNNMRYKLILAMNKEGQ